MPVFLVVVHDQIVQSREYAVLAKDEEDAKAKVAKGEHLTESEPTTMDTVGTKIISAEQVGETHASL
jgi:hypothetical protein